MTNTKHKNFNFSLFQVSNLICFIVVAINLVYQQLKKRE